MKNIFTSLLFFLTTNIYCQNIPLSDFTLTEMPAANSPLLYKLNNSVLDFFVTKDSNEISINKYKENYQKEIKSKYGTFYAINMGEWGGGLYFEPIKSVIQFYVNGTYQKTKNDPWSGGLLIKDDHSANNIVKKSILIKNGNAKEFVHLNNELYFIEGLLHIGSSYGALYRIKSYKDSVNIETILRFDEAPMTFTSFADFLIIATAQGVYKFKDENLETIVTNLPWAILYPNSIVCLNYDEVYIGIRGGYVKLKLSTKKLELYRYKQISVE